MWEPYIGRFCPGWLVHTGRHSLKKKKRKQNHNKTKVEMTQMVEHLYSMCKAMSSNTSEKNYNKFVIQKF
jgi:hypothetical protein